MSHAAPAHRGRGPVDHAEQRALLAPLEQRLEKLQVRLRGLVEHERVLHPVGREQARVVGQLALGVDDVRDDRAGCGQHISRRREAPGLQRDQRGVAAWADQPTQVPARGLGLEEDLPGARHRDAPQAFARGDRCLRVVVGQQDLSGLQTTELATERGRPQDLGRPKVTGRDIQRRQREAVFGPTDERDQVVVGALIEALTIEDDPGRDDPRDAALDDALGLSGVLKLVTHGHLETRPQRARQVGRELVVRKARHRRGHGRVLVAARDGQAEVLPPQLRVRVEHLVEVAHPKEEQRVGVALLRRDVLPHHGGELHAGWDAEPSLQRDLCLGLRGHRAVSTRTRGRAKAARVSSPGPRRARRRSGRAQRAACRPRDRGGCRAEPTAPPPRR